MGSALADRDFVSVPGKPGYVTGPEEKELLGRPFFGQSDCDKAQSSLQGKLKSHCAVSVSYTHLDVYKRQLRRKELNFRLDFCVKLRRLPG